MRLLLALLAACLLIGSARAQNPTLSSYPLVNPLQAATDSLPLLRSGVSSPTGYFNERVSLMTFASWLQSQGFTQQSGSIATGDCLKWAPGIADAGLCGAPMVATNAALTATSTASVPAGAIVRAGYYAAGDGGGAIYTASGNACSLNAGAGDGGSQIPSADGKCWLLAASAIVDARIFGAKCDASTDDSSAINAAAAYILAIPNHKNTMLTLGGQVCAIGSPILINGNGLTFGDGTGSLKALAGSWSAGTFAPTDPFTGTEPTGMVDINGSSQFISVNLFLNANNQANTSGLVVHDNIASGISYSGYIQSFGAYGIFLGSGARIQARNCVISQNQQVSGRVGYGIYAAGAGDSLFVDCLDEWSKVPLYVDSNSADIAFRAGHLFNGATAAQGGTSAWNPINVSIGGSTTLVADTIDNGAIEIVAGSSSLGPAIITDNLFEYGATAAWSMPAWFRFTTAYSNSGGALLGGQNSQIRISNNIMPTVSGGQNMSLEGTGSWAAPATILQGAINSGGDSTELNLGGGTVNQYVYPVSGV